MPVKLIRPPNTKDVTLFLRQLFLRAERQIINEITRKRAAGYVDYAEVAALERVQQILQNMQDECWEYVPEMVEKIFYESDKDAAGYANARALTATQTAAVQQLSNNLLGEILEASETAYKTVQSFYTIARLESDPFRAAAIKQVAAQEASGIGWTQTSARMAQELKNQGITAFVDKAGRKWTLSDYCNMATRTTARQAEVSAVLTADEHDLWQIVKIGSTCPVCAPLEGRVYSKSGLNPNYPPLTLAFGKIDPAGANDLSNTYLNIHPNCLVPGGSILCEGLMAASRRYYTGDVITIKTSAGNEITVTPNHPILTTKGFVAAGSLKEGDKIIEATAKYASFLGKTPDNVYIPTGIEEIFHSIIKSGDRPSFGVKGSSVQFHGDGIPDRKVDVVFATSFGVNKRNAVRNKPLAKKHFPPAHFGRLFFFSNGSLAKIFIRTLHSFNCFVSSFCFVFGRKFVSENCKKLSNFRHGTPAFGCDLRVRKTLIMKIKKCFKFFPMRLFVFWSYIKKFFGSFWNVHTIVNPSGSNSLGRYAKMFGNFGPAESFLAKRFKRFLSDDIFVISELTHIKPSFYDGYVYNMETEPHYYVYNNIVTHNCLHSLTKYTTIGKTEKQIQRDIDFSDPTLNPLSRDPRTKKQIAAYREKERNRRKLLDDMKQWKRYRAVLGDDAYKTFETFRKHKLADDDVYKRLQAEYRKQNREIREALSDNEI